MLLVCDEDICRVNSNNKEINITTCLAVSQQVFPELIEHCLKLCLIVSEFNFNPRRKGEQQMKDSSSAATGSKRTS